MMDNFQVPKSTNPRINEEQLLQLFKNIYSLPKSVDLLKMSSPGHQGQPQKVKSFQKFLLQIIDKFKIDPSVYQAELTIQSFQKAQALIKQILLDQIYLRYPNKVYFSIINDINIKLNGKYEKQCQDLLMDLIEKNKELKVKKQIQSFIVKKFKIYDIDGSGDISIKQLQERLSSLSLPKSVAIEIMQNADQEKDGIITFKQFKEYVQKKILRHYKVFFNVDQDKNQLLNYNQTKQSLLQIYPSIPIENGIFDKIFKTMDQDDSGFINFQEWCEFLIVFPQQNLNMLVSQWGKFASTMVDQSSSFLNEDLLKATSDKNGKKIFSYWDILRTLIFGAISGGISRTITAPLQRLKIIYQTMYTTSKCPSILTGLRDTYTQHGLASLFKGNSISVFMNCLQQSLRFSFIQYSKGSYEAKSEKIHPHQFLLIGIATGIFSSLVLYPFQVIRIRFITSEGNSVYNKIGKIYQISGPKGFYSGLTPYLISVLPAGSFNVMSYNMLRHFFISQNDDQNPKIYKFMFIGGVAALITNIFTYPLSLIGSRLIMANKEIKIYKDKIKTHVMVKNIYNGEGFLGFFKGFRASLLRVFIGQSINFGTYQTLKSVWKLKSELFNSIPKSKRY